MRTLIIIRGPSGAGKTTLAKRLLEGNFGHFFEADQFFMIDGQYSFDASRLGQAHKDCQLRVRKAMEKTSDPLVVSNTNMTRWELNPYLQMAVEYNYTVKVYRIKGPWDAKLFAARNLHGLSEANIQRQIDKYQPLENEEEYAG